ncbi:hypothetical protein E1180_17715 [Roseibium denhamense]|uniref:Glycerophosphoryl diester phosphodiesterase membrane domain-containing protein n=1 Tax=Roseibium denhamense TaxID=76305 RepID=A0ABY1P9F2_9HYPH|nr:hypothetical protein [Roseibium denhamense]MTI07343.1 hypothetical protein [Roseibium denhamense]SMP28945.1 hypothetical protein SAMN06265374_3032 [Roseibium denhamense]
MFMTLIKSSLSLVFENFSTVIQTTLAWLLIQLVVAVALIFGIAFFATSGAGGPLLITVLPLLSAVIGLIAMSSIAVTWHRFGLLGEGVNGVNLKFGGLELQYLWRALVLGLGFGLVVAVPGIIGTVLGSQIIMAALTLAAILLASPILARTGLVLPAVAAGEPLSFKAAYDLGKGLGWWIILASVAIAIPFAIAGAILQFGIGAVTAILPSFVGLVLGGAVNVVVQMVVTVLALSVVTNAYRMAKSGAAETAAMAGNAGAAA